MIKKIRSYNCTTSTICNARDSEQKWGNGFYTCKVQRVSDRITADDDNAILTGEKKKKKRFTSTGEGRYKKRYIDGGSV